MDQQVEQIPLELILADEEFNCRGPIDPINVVELAKSIERSGLLQPVTLSPITEELKKKHPDKKYRLVAGFRRLKAHQVLGLPTIRALVHESMMDEVAARYFNLEENINREDLSIMQEARALEKLRELRVPRDEVAAKLNKSSGWVQVRYYLLELPPEIQEEAERGTITQSQIKEIRTIYKTAGKDTAMLAVRRAKEAKEKGLKNVSININKIKPTAKHHRNRAEIADMLDILFDSIGGGLHTRCLAWAAGDIATLELYNDIRTECTLKGKVFVPPENLFNEREEFVEGLKNAAKEGSQSGSD